METVTTWCAMNEDAIIAKVARVTATKELWPQLTRRQIECICLFLMGFTQAESGQILGIDRSVVSRHLLGVLDKLG